jgi:spore germination cell wall hydrolase CwlJ-like protein
MKRTIPDVPDAKLNFVIAAMKVDKPTSITKEKQDNGLWTVIGEFPDHAVTSNKATTMNKMSSTKSTPPVSSGNQSNIDASDSAIDTLARTLWGEARGETKAGREAIASVILNRLKKNKPSRFGGTIEEVCQKPSQFSCWNADDPNLPKLKKVDVSNPVFAECVAIAENVVQGLLVDSVIGADHYHTAGVSPAWSRGKVPCITIGNHLFFNNIA